MIQDSDIEVLNRIYCTPITPELVMREGFEIKKTIPSIRETLYIHKELGLGLTQHDRQNLVVAKSGYPYAFTVKFTIPTSISFNLHSNSPRSKSNTNTNTQTSTFSYSIYTYGQLLAIIEAKAKLNDLQKRIDVEVEDIISAVYSANKYKTSK